jgi:hypothetical protein
MSAKHILPSDVISNSVATCTRLGQKFRPQGIGATRGEWERRLARIESQLVEFAANPVMAQRLARDRDEIRTLLGIDDSIADLRRQVSAEHRKLDAGEGDPSQFTALKKRLDRARGR